MNNKNNITLLASFAIDRLFDSSGFLLREQKGGPALFLQKALATEKIAFKVFSSVALEVEILITSQGEFGRVKTKVKPVKVNWQSINAPAVLISTILDEYNLNGIEEYKNQVFLDVQGYVRNGDDFGKKKYWDFNPSLISCVKGTEEEISYLSKDFIEKQKKKMLLITLGPSGSVLYFKNEAVRVKPSKVVLAPDTIGAGDSFFAYFVAEYLRSNNPKQSLEYATVKTTSFLSSKLHHTNPF